MEIHKWGPERDQMVSYWNVKRTRPDVPADNVGQYAMVCSSRIDLPAKILLALGPGDYVLDEQSDPAGMTPVWLGKYGLEVRYEYHSGLVPWQDLFSTPSAASKRKLGRRLDEKITKAIELRYRDNLSWFEIGQKLIPGFDLLSKIDQRQQLASLRSSVSKRLKRYWLSETEKDFASIFPLFQPRAKKPSLSSR